MNEQPHPPPLPKPLTSGGGTEARVFRGALVTMLAVGLGLTVWLLRELILILIACALVALMFGELAMLLQRRLKLPFWLALLTAVVLPLALISATIGAFGALMVEQLMALTSALPAAYEEVRAWLARTATGQQVIDQAMGLMPDGNAIAGLVQSVASGAGTAISTFIIILVGGIYFAAQPKLYTTGILNLFPAAARPAVIHYTDSVHRALMSWLKAQGVSMLFVGVGTGVALSLVGIPSAPAIGVVAGLCEFVPYLGVILVSVPVIIIGFSMGVETGIWTIVALVVVQQLQGNVVTPMAQATIVELPPALTIFSLIAAAVLLGPLGVVLAVPLTVIGMTILRERAKLAAVTVPVAASEALPLD
ncbi:MAG: AI-2E family transporter [Thermaurantiacus sp.]